MSMVAQQAPYTLFILDDEDAPCPREDRDNFGTMVCFHKRYSLGDEHNYSEPSDFLRELMLEVTPAQEIIDYAKSNKSDTLRFEYNKSSKEWEVSAYSDFLKQWFVEATFEAPIKGQEVEISEAIAENMRNSELMDMARNNAVILPLYLYDHSGITMNTSGFSCPWDSGQVGWIYATHEEVKKKYGDLSPENLGKAESLLQSEVEEYDLYLTGQCYGFRLYKDKDEIDSCWGFLSSFTDIGKQIAEHLPDECKDMVYSLEYQSGSLDEDEYLCAENEYGEDLER